MRNTLKTPSFRRKSEHKPSLPQGYRLQIKKQFRHSDLFYKFVISGKKYAVHSSIIIGRGMQAEVIWGNLEIQAALSG